MFACPKRLPTVRVRKPSPVSRSLPESRRNVFMCQTPLQATMSNHPQLLCLLDSMAVHSQGWVYVYIYICMCVNIETVYYILYTFENKYNNSRSQPRPFRFRPESIERSWKQLHQCWAWSNLGGLLISFLSRKCLWHFMLLVRELMRTLAKAYSNLYR